jgi:hypothetical protein
MEDSVQIKTNTLLEIRAGDSLFEIEFEPFRSESGGAGIGVYLNKSLTQYQGISSSTVDKIKRLIANYAQQKQAKLRFE